MACTSLTRGRNLNCNRISGGIKAVYFAVLDQITSITYDSTAAPNQVREIDDIDMGSNRIIGVPEIVVNYHTKSIVQFPELLL